jgi:hypothetical protein
MSNNATTIALLLATLRQLTEGDRQRVLQFASDILTDRQGKRQQRQQRHQGRHPPIDDGWRIGE